MGYSPALYCHQAAVPCVIAKIEDRLDLQTGEIIEENPEYLFKGDGATVWIEPRKPLVIEEVSKTPRLGRFALRDVKGTVATGACIEVVPKEV